MDIFKNIKEFFIPPEEDGDDYEERPSRREREPEHRSSSLTVPGRLRQI